MIKKNLKILLSPQKNFTIHQFKSFPQFDSIARHDRTSHSFGMTGAEPFTPHKLRWLRLDCIL
jgi:hypothetical protein